MVASPEFGDAGTPEMSSNFEALQALMAASKAKQHDAFLDLWDDELEYYWSVHKKPITSKETMRKFLRNYESAFDQKEWTLTNWIEKGDLLFCEGVEMIYDRARNTLIRNPYMQAVEFRNGKIAKMRDYYDGSVVSPPARQSSEGAAA